VIGPVSEGPGFSPGIAIAASSDLLLPGLAEARTLTVTALIAWIHALPRLKPGPSLSLALEVIAPVSEGPGFSPGTLGIAG